MLIPIRRRTRGGEHGQTLILALVFVAFFGLVIGSILRFGDVASLQHVRTEATSSTDTLAEGGAAYGAADAGRPASDVTVLCNAGESASLTMQSGDTVGYTVNACNPGETAVPGGSPGENCLLCVLNINPPTDPTTAVVTLKCDHCSGPDITTNGGDVYINGAIASGSLTALPSSGANASVIRLLEGALAGSTCTCVPGATQFSPAITDPLAAIGAPSPVAARPSGCTNPNWDPVTGCSATFSGNGQGNTMNPGLWSSVTVSGGAGVTMNPGVYVFTGGLTATGSGVFSGTGVVVYLACPTYGSTGQACAAGGSAGGFVDFGGNGSITITSPTSGQYNGIAVIADPHLLDPKGVAKCVSGAGSSCLYNLSGNGAAVTGTIDTRSGGISFQANGGAVINSGRLITNSLNMDVTGNVGSGLSLSGSITVVHNTCGVFDDAVSGTRSGTTSTGRAIIQSQCAGGSGLVDFNYTP